MTTPAHLGEGVIPGGMEVDLEIKIHTRLNISAYVAKQRANVALSLYCGQAFAVDEPILQVGTLVRWLVPVWLAPSQKRGRTKIGELVVNAQTGEVVDSGEQCRALREIANSLLLASPAAPAPSE